MNVIKILFIFLAMMSIFCASLDAKFKRRNYGYIAATVLIAISDIICSFLFDVSGVNEVRNVMVAYYICHAWILFSILWMMIGMDKNGRFKILLLPVAFTSTYQTVLMASQLLGNKVIFFQKHIMFGRTWWVAVDSNQDFFLYSFKAYRVMNYISLIIVLIALVGYLVTSHRIFRSRYIVMGVILIGYIVLLTLTTHYSLPVWIECLVYNLISIPGFYLVRYYNLVKLRDWSMDNFANEMSDGFILYDDHDDLIHMNEMVKRTLSEDLLKSFADKKLMDEWARDTEDIESIEVIHYVVNNRDYYFDVQVNNLGEKDAPLGTLYIIHDTTQSIMRIRAMEMANQELERAAQMKSDFLANMSHEIRTPMNGVIGMTEIALREDISPQVAECLNQIQKSGRNLLNIINDILDFTKIEAGRMEIIPENYEPVTEIQDIGNILATRVGDKDIELFMITEPDIPHALYGDAMRIRQILINLANNAIKFTDKGSVYVHVSCERIDDDHVNMIYHVYDSGIGIKEEDLEKLFISFQQLDSKRNRSVEGTGLGLAISQRLVEAMNGRIGVNSVYRKGSDFWFMLPQKVLDPEPVLKVEDAANKRATVINSEERMVNMFLDEMARLGVEADNITSIDEYSTSDKKDYLFFVKSGYDDAVKNFLDEHPDVTGIVLVRFESEFKPDRQNLRVMRRPETTLGMVNILNDVAEAENRQVSKKAYKIDYKAPEAKILVVDDNEINISIAQGLLAPMNAIIDSALSGQEAIDKVNKTDYDIVLMDHMMPEMDGVETTQLIRKFNPVHPIIIAQSANVLADAQKLFAQAGMNDFIAKPIDVRDMAEKIRKWLPEEKIITIAGVEAETDDVWDNAFLKSGMLDFDKAIGALGSAELYLKIASEYYRTGRDKIEGIESALQRNDIGDYTIRVHALKSSSRQIGAFLIGGIAEKMEMAGKAGDIETINKHNDKMIDMFSDLISDMEPYFDEPEEDESSKPVILAEDLNRFMDDLTTACDELDMDAMEAVKKGFRAYRFDDAVKENIDKLLKAIDSMDTDECMEVIELIRTANG